MPNFTAERLFGFSASVLEALLVPSADAALVADCLVAADLEGQATHGIARLPFMTGRLRDGLVNPRPAPAVLRESAAAVLLDADNGLGAVVGARAIELASAKAAVAGVGLCAVRHGNHLGALAWYVERAAASGMIGLALSNTPPAMAPPGGQTAYLGTNPIAAAFPTSGAPVVVDMATSQVARGRLLQAAQAGRPIPEGWAVDARGHPTTDPAVAIGGLLEPLGGAKGFALALMVEVLSGVIAGAAVGPGVGGTYLASERISDVGQSFWVLDPGSFGPGYVARMDGLVEGIRQVDPADPSVPVRLPGDRRRQERQRRSVDGIELSDSLVDELDGIALPLAGVTLGGGVRRK